MNFTFTESEVAGILQGSPNIKHVSLKNFHMVHGSWERLLGTIEQKMLERFEIGSIMEKGKSIDFDTVSEDGETFESRLEGFMNDDQPNPFSLDRKEESRI